MAIDVIPTSSAELEEFLTDKKKMSEVLSEGKLPEFITNYARVHAKANVDVGKQVDEQVQQTMAAWLKEHGATLRRPDMTTSKLTTPGGSKRSAMHNPDAMGAALDGEFKNIAEYAQTIHHHADRTDATISKRISTLKNAMSSTVPSEGGFLIPEEFRAELLRVALETAIVRPRARVIPMSTLRTSFPALDSTSNASSVFGGVIAYWTEEAAALVNSSPSFSKIVLDAKKLTAYTEIPNELVDDSAISLDTFLSEIFPEALAWYEDAAFLAGTGVGEPLGALNAGNSSIIAVTKEVGQAAATLVYENLIKMYARMLPAALNRAVWVASIDTFPELATMALSVGTGGTAVWMGQGGAAGTPPVTILGRPVIFTEKTSVLGTQGDISFVDFGHYLIGDRQAMTAMASPHFKFGNDVTAYRIIQRVDGRPWLQSAITPKNSGPTLSPFVQVQTR